MKNWTNEEVINAIKAIQKRITNWHRNETFGQMAMDRESLSAFIAEMKRRQCDEK